MRTAPSRDSLTYAGLFMEARGPIVLNIIRAVDLSNELNNVIAFEHEGVLVRVKPGSSVEDLAISYNKAKAAL
jgi:hypothetical protein